MKSLAWGPLAIRLFALLLYASLPLWVFMTAASASVCAYEWFTGALEEYAPLVVVDLFALTAATWWLARLFWRRADQLLWRSDADADDTDAGSAARMPCGGEELLTAGIVIFGACLLIKGIRSPLIAWYLYHSTIVLFAESGLSGEDYAVSQAGPWVTDAVFQIVTALLLIFTGRRVAARLFGHAPAGR